MVLHQIEKLEILFLTVEDLGYSQNGEQIFDHVSFSISPKDKVSFVSDHELAVTTFFKIIMGEITDYTGTFQWGVTTSQSYFPKDNNEFFDDMTGDAWEAVKESIKTSGIIEPIVVTKDMIIVSGHQRVRAAKELGLSTVIVDIRKYENDDKVLKDLIETNIRQRGIGNPNPIKLGRCIKELERIYGVEHGGDRKTSNPKLSDLNQSDIAEMIGISVDTLNNYKKLTELIPELEDLVETGILAPTTATALVKLMTPSEQEDFVKSMDITQKITQKQVQQYINEIKQLKQIIQK